jgi:murein L,D-transpeptidase YcbB/YkuD
VVAKTAGDVDVRFVGDAEPEADVVSVEDQLEAGAGDEVGGRTKNRLITGEQHRPHVRRGAIDHSRFQEAHDLEVDGLVGPDTWAALVEFGPSSCGSSAGCVSRMTGCDSSG